MHILLMAGIFDDDRVTTNGVGVVPLPCFSHKPSLFLPSFENWRAAEERLLNLAHIPYSPLSIANNIFCVESMPILQGNMSIEIPDSTRCVGSYLISERHFPHDLKTLYQPRLNFPIRPRTDSCPKESASRSHLHKAMVLKRPSRPVHLPCQEPEGVDEFPHQR